MSLTNKQKKLVTPQHLKELREQGLTYRQIALKVKIPQNSLYYYMNKYDLVKHR